MTLVREVLNAEEMNVLTHMRGIASINPGGVAKSWRWRIDHAKECIRALLLANGGTR